MLVEFFCEDDIDERADVEMKAEDEDIVIVEGGKNGMTMQDLRKQTAVGAAAERDHRSK